MDAKNVAKKIAILILSLLFFTIAPIAINLYILKDFSVENTLTDLSSAATKDIIGNQLDSNCKNQTMVSFNDCKSMLLRQMCLSVEGCSPEKAADVDAFVDIYLAPKFVSQALNVTITDSGVKVSDIKPMMNDLLNITSVITITLLLLLLLIIRDAREAMKIFGANFFWIGASLVFFGFFLSEIFPAMLFDMTQKTGLDENTISAVYEPVSKTLKPIINSEYQIGIMIALLGALMALFSQFFMKPQRN